MPFQKPIKPTVLQPGDRFLTSQEAAEILRTSIATLNYWRVLGRGPRFYRHNRSVRYLLSDLTAWGTAQCVEPNRVSA
jgi:Helix-turn-helix domain